MTTITMSLIKSRGRIPTAHLRTLTHAHVLILKPYTRTRRFLRTRAHTRTWTRLSHDTCVCHQYESSTRAQNPSMDVGMLLAHAHAHALRVRECVGVGVGASLLPPWAYKPKEKRACRKRGAGEERGLFIQRRDKERRQGEETRGGEV
jgi:hypothetical protein